MTLEQIILHCSKGFQVIIEPFNVSFFGISGRGLDLDYCDTEWFTLETNRNHSVIFEIATKYCISDSFVDYEATPFLLGLAQMVKNLPAVWEIWV